MQNGSHFRCIKLGGNAGPVNMLWNRFLTAHNTLGCSHSGGALNCNWSSPFQGIECGGLLTFCAFICLNDLRIAILSVVYDGKFWADRFELDTVSCVNCYATAHDDAIVDFWALIFARKSSAFPSFFFDRGAIWATQKLQSDLSTFRQPSHVCLISIQLSGLYLFVPFFRDYFHARTRGLNRGRQVVIFNFFFYVVDKLSK